MEKLLDRFVALVEKFMLPLVLVIGFLVYQRISGLFGGNKEKEKEAEAQAMQEHNNALVPEYTKVPKAASEAQRRKITEENGEKAKLFFQARSAEKLHAAMKPGIDFFRESKLVEIADYMKQHKASLKGTAAQYKKLSGNDLYADARTLLGSKYAAWLGVAGSTP